MLTYCVSVCGVGDVVSQGRILSELDVGAASTPKLTSDVQHLFVRQRKYNLVCTVFFILRLEEHLMSEEIFIASSGILIDFKSLCAQIISPNVLAKLTFKRTFCYYFRVCLAVCFVYLKFAREHFLDKI